MVMKALAERLHHHHTSFLCLAERELFEDGLGNAFHDEHDRTPVPGQIDHLFVIPRSCVDALVALWPHLDAFGEKGDGPAYK